MKRKEIKRKIDKIWETHHSNKNKLEQKRSSIRRQIREGWLKTRMELYPRMEDIDHPDDLDEQGYKKFNSFLIDEFHYVNSDDGITFHPGDD